MIGAAPASPVTERATLNAAQLASLLGINLKLVYQGHARREIPGGFKIGRRLLFSRAAIQRFLDGAS
ncbi:MAG: helix-turn-helix domain-containing protein [Candidatus Baltobacteraceae bacterium]